MSDMTQRNGKMLICPECGSANEPDAAFCGVCGAYLEWDGDQAAPVEPEPEPVPEPEPAAEAAVPEPEKASLISRLRSEFGRDAGSSPTAAPAQESAAAPDTLAAPTLAMDAGAAAGVAAAEAVVAEPVAEQPVVKKASSHPVAKKPAADQTAAKAPTATQPVARQPEAVRPGTEADLTRRKSAAPTDDLAPRPGEVICGQCGAGNAPDRKFCRRCGKDLAGSPVVPPTPWWRRMFQRQPRTVAAGTRHKVRRRSRLPGWLLTLAVLAAIVFAVYRFAWPAFGPTAVEAVQDRISETQRFEPASLDASSAAPDHGAAFARDGDPATYWMPERGVDPTGQFLEATFEHPFRLVAIQFFNGASREDAVYLTIGRPAEVVLTLTRSDGTEDRHELTLKDDPNQQDHLLGVSDVTKVRMTIKTTFGDPATGVALGEMAFFTRS